MAGFNPQRNFRGVSQFAGPHDADENPVRSMVALASQSVRSYCSSSHLPKALLTHDLAKRTLGIMAANSRYFKSVGTPGPPRCKGTTPGAKPQQFLLQKADWHCFYFGDRFARPTRRVRLLRFVAPTRHRVLANPVPYSPLMVSSFHIVFEAERACILIVSELAATRPCRTSS
jgi:hypothetical protein